MMRKMRNRGAGVTQRIRTAGCAGVILLTLGCAPRGNPPEPTSRGTAPDGGQQADPPVGRVTFGAILHDLPPRQRRELAPPPAGGVLLGDVLALGPAARAGLRRRDVIVALDGAPVRSPCELLKVLGGKAPGESVQLLVQRPEETFNAAVTLEEAVPLYTLSCDTGHAAGCLLLAWETDGARAVELAEEACRLGLADGCAAAGKAYLDGAGAVRDEARSLDFFKRSCLMGGAAGCASAAFQYATGRGVPQDDERATDLYVKSCAEGDPAGCYNVGLMMEKGRGTEKDLTRALTAYTEGCDGGSFLACTNLGFLVEHGEGTPPDEVRAAGYYRRACAGDGCGDRDPKGCLNLGICSLHGRGVREDPERAAELFRQACDGGEADACARLAAR